MALFTLQFTEKKDWLDATDHTAVCFGTRNIPLVTKQLPYLRSPYTIIFHQSCLNAGSQLM